MLDSVTLTIPATVGIAAVCGPVVLAAIFLVLRAESKERRRAPYCLYDDDGEAD